MENWEKLFLMNLISIYHLTGLVRLDCFLGGGIHCSLRYANIVDFFSKKK